MSVVKCPLPCKLVCYWVCSLSPVLLYWIYFSCLTKQCICDTNAVPIENVAVRSRPTAWPPVKPVKSEVNRAGKTLLVRYEAGRSTEENRVATWMRCSLGWWNQITTVVIKYSTIWVAMSDWHCSCICSCSDSKEVKKSWVVTLVDLHTYEFGGNVIGGISYCGR